MLDALVRGVYSYRSFTTWTNGSRNRVRNGYVTDYLTESAGRSSGASTGTTTTPFFAWISHVGPHNARRPSVLAGGAAGARRCRPDRDLGDFAGLRSPSRDLPSLNRRSDETGRPSCVTSSG